MSEEQIEAHDEAGEFLHMPGEVNRVLLRSYPVEYRDDSLCVICGAPIYRSLVNQHLWLERTTNAEAD